MAMNTSYLATRPSEVSEANFYDSAEQSYFDLLTAPCISAGLQLSSDNSKNGNFTFYTVYESIFFF